jgi:hypothetical protein
MHAVLSWPEAGTPPDAPATRQEEAEGFPLAPPAEACSDAVDGALPHIVPRLALDGTPGDASALVHVDALLGSSAATSPAEAPNAPRAVDRFVARTREPEVE